MCCRNRRAVAPASPRRQCQPLLFTLGQFVYSKYQQRRDSRAALPMPATEMNGEQMQRRSSPPPEVLELAANEEILERAGVKGPPPRYEDVIIDNGASLRSNGSSSSSISSSSDSSENSGETKDFFDGPEKVPRDDDAGSLFGEREMETSVDDDAVVEKKELTRHQRKHAEKMARKVEKKMEKAERAARRADRAAKGL